MNIITIESVNYSGEVANILFKPVGVNVVINLGNQVLPYAFDPSLLTPSRDVYGVYTILIEDADCPVILNVPLPTPTPTPTMTQTPTVTPTQTVTPSPTPTFNPCLVTKTPTTTPTNTPSITPTSETPTPTPTNTLTPTPTSAIVTCEELLVSVNNLYINTENGDILSLAQDLCPSQTPTNTPTNTPTPTITPSITPTSETPTPTPTNTPTPTFDPLNYMAAENGDGVTTQGDDIIVFNT